jgi:sugar (pentulose or hexulose) kinase
VEQLADDAKPGSYDTIALLGPQIMDASDMTTVRPAMFIFPQPASPVTIPISLNELTRSLFENICYAIRANLDLLKEKAGATFERCFVAGGLSRSRFWQQILADVTNLEVQRSQVVEASSLGAAICAAKAAEVYSSLQEGVDQMVTLQPPIHPRSEVFSIYETFFSRWKVLYKQSTNL